MCYNFHRFLCDDKNVRLNFHCAHLPLGTNAITQANWLETKNHRKSKKIIIIIFQQCHVQPNESWRFPFYMKMNKKKPSFSISCFFLSVQDNSNHLMIYLNVWLLSWYDFAIETANQSAIVSQWSDHFSLYYKCWALGSQEA